MEKTIAVLVRDKEQQYEALRVCLSFILENNHVQMFVLNHKISPDDDEYLKALDFLDEIKGERYTNQGENAENYGFRFLTTAEIGKFLDQASLVIPF